MASGLFCSRSVQVFPRGKTGTTNRHTYFLNIHPMLSSAPSRDVQIYCLRGVDCSSNFYCPSVQRQSGNSSVGKGPDTLFSFDERSFALGNLCELYRKRLFPWTPELC